MSDASGTDDEQRDAAHGRASALAGAHGLLDAPPAGAAYRIARQAGEHRRPATVSLIVAIAGLIVMGVVIAGIGLLLTHVLLIGALGRWDERVNDWLVAQRTTSMNALTSVGTNIGSTGTVAAVAVVSVVILTISKLWQEIGLIIIALSVEGLVFLMTAVIVNRPRPSVPRLDPSPPTASFPSGHTAAAIALWVSLAIVISVHVRNTFIRTLVWIVGLGLPIFVGVSRLYRGMHHPTDVMGSVLLGTGALVTALLAVRAGSGVAEIQDTREEVAVLERTTEQVMS